MARLDRLAPIKEIAQIGAAIGREFSYRLLEAVSPIHGPALQDALGQLMAAELIDGRGAPPEATYIFKHALVQDTAYASLLRGRRQHIHAEIARALEGRFVDQINSAPAVIARHYTEAGLAEPAARNWLRGGGIGAVTLGSRGGAPLCRRRPGADPPPDGRSEPPISPACAPTRPRERASAAEGLHRIGNGGSLNRSQAASRLRRSEPICNASPCFMPFGQAASSQRKWSPR